MILLNTFRESWLITEAVLQQFQSLEEIIEKAQQNERVARDFLIRLLQYRLYSRSADALLSAIDVSLLKQIILAVEKNPIDPVVEATLLSTKIAMVLHQRSVFVPLSETDVNYFQQLQEILQDKTTEPYALLAIFPNFKSEKLRTYWKLLIELLQLPNYSAAMNTLALLAPHFKLAEPAKLTLGQRIQLKKQQERSDQNFSYIFPLKVPATKAPTDLPSITEENQKQLVIIILNCLHRETCETQGYDHEILASTNTLVALYPILAKKNKEILLKGLGGLLSLLQNHNNVSVHLQPHVALYEHLSSTDKKSLLTLLQLKLLTTVDVLLISMTVSTLYPKLDDREKHNMITSLKLLLINKDAADEVKNEARGFLKKIEQPEILSQLTSTSPQAAELIQRHSLFAKTPADAPVPSLYDDVCNLENYQSWALSV